MAERARSPLLLPLLALLLAGCGGSSKDSAEEAAAASKAAPLKILHTFEARGDQPSGIFHAIAVVGETLLAGTEDGLDVLAYDPAEGFVEKSRVPLRSNPVSAAKVHHIRVTGPGEAWIASSDGVARFQGGKVNLQEQSGPARDVTVFKGVTWIARSRSMELYEPVSSQIKKVALDIQSDEEGSNLPQVKQPLSFCPTSSDDLYVGTQFGLLHCHWTGQGDPGWRHHYGKWDRVSGNSILPVPGNNKLPGNRIYNLRLSPDGKRLAVCTDKGLGLVDLETLKDWTHFVGLHRVNKADSVRGLFHEEVPGNVDMPSSDIHDMAWGMGVLYLATPKGLVVVPAAGPGTGPVTVMDVSSGLPSSNVTGLALDPQRKILFVATSFGLAALRTP